VIIIVCYIVIIRKLPKTDMALACSENA
jgi:hypothetical protein